jgi:methionyl-tRNA formyltransferase
MKLAFLSAADPLYLPQFFERVLKEFRRETDYVYVVPPLYKGQTPRAAAWRYYRTFGARAVVGLLRRLIQAKLSRSSIAHVCARLRVGHGVVTDVNAPEFIAELKRQEIDFVISVSCPQIFKKALLEAPTRGCLNIHGALLPRYRGVMPSFWMLANGEREAGVTVYLMNEDIDAGEVVGQRSFEIKPNETLDEFLRRSKRVSAELLIDVLCELREGTGTRQAMDMSDGSYYSWPDRDAVRRFSEAGRRLW